MAPTTRTRSRPAATSLPGPASAGMPGRRCGSSQALLPRPGARAWARPPGHAQRPAATSLPGPASAGMPGRRCGSSQRCCLDRERVLGPDHPDTLTTRSNIAFSTGECGDAREALRLFTGAAPRRGARTRPRPPRHAHDPQQHRFLDRPSSAMPGRRCGSSQPLLPEQERVLWPDHPDTLAIRKWIDYLSVG